MTAAQAPVADVDWYHSIELPDGSVTPGSFDLRPSTSVVPLPRSLAGMRCLDVGTWDGFWAFEMERRGAAEVVAIDIDDPDGWDWPPRERLSARRGGLAWLAAHKRAGAGFDLAARALGSRARRVDRSVYDLDPNVDGRFDLVFVGSLLLHLRDPVAALDRVRGVCAGEAVVADAVDAIASLLRPRTPVARLEGIERPWWWQPNRAALHRMVEAAGWEVVEATGVYFLPTGPAHPQPPVGPAMARALLTARGRERLLIRFRGVPHAAVRVRPAR